MELRQIKYFIAVAEELHFGKAAQRCHIAQPPLSQQIKRLEEELEVKLLERTSRRVSLTPEGEEFLVRCRDIQDRLTEAVACIQDMAQGLEGMLRIGFIGPASLSQLPMAIRAFREANPNIRLDFSAKSTTEQLPVLRSDRLDIAFVRLFGHDTTGLKSMLFLREPYVLAIPDGHHFSKKDRIDIRDLEGEPLIFNQRIAQPALYRSLIGSFHKAGFMPNIVQEVNTEQSTVALVSTGLGVALVPASSARDKRSGVSFKPLDGDLPQWEITALWKAKNESVILKKFIETLKEFQEIAEEPAIWPR
ncbi:Transcriptional regulator, LysR family [Pseudodesulfovibrio profundus]|uniref:Transcriptional regulator, LysR family n=1 Tax=Pseudodesulfovibrio profundus TaxID=57320 RepID=A0A2C8FBR8_9BACT|nr:LysR family transcriptional regulator [Pseudodesulfovibrio profundus]MBC15569.1 LysR family transcriptional regulator [Desulfovibrio sp.]SOB59877.1 Transcriptional regulator, LysR family [Pseudodesulfovibrio profundus]|tara:strand:+ start:863 stop:1777 length:915 start_codon:yes stop_codon:yes gene_type:complete